MTSARSTLDHATAAAPLAGVDSLAIVCPSWIGDTIMATPVLRAARQCLPKARIIGVVRPGLDEILPGTAWLDEIVVCDMKGALGPLRLGRAIRGQRCSAVLLLPNSFRSALGARLSGAAIRAGYDRDRRGWLLTHKLKTPVPFNTPIPAVEYYAGLAEMAFADVQVDRRLELATTQAERDKAREMLRGIDRTFVLLNPGATRADKRWPAERFAKVADQLHASHGLAVVVSGSPREKAVLDAVMRSARTTVVNLAERGSTLGALKAVIERAAVVITNDTGPRHIAAALGTPVVTLFGPTDPRWTTLQGVRERVLVAEPFLPEELVADRHHKACSIEKIAVADVVHAATSLLSEQGCHGLGR